MKHSSKFKLRGAMLLMGVLFLAACAEPGTYPISGEECGPSDPVKDLDAADCMPVPAG